MIQVYYFQHLGIAAYRVTNDEKDWILLKIEDPRIKARRFISLAAFEQEYQHVQQSVWYQLIQKRFALIEAYDAGTSMPGADEWEQFVAAIDNRQ